MINYTTLKRLDLANPSLLPNLVTALLQYGLHYYKWKHAICVVIPKQGKSNYTVAKSYRPISLSCLGKIIEKIIESRIASLGKICGAISSIQFGNKEGHPANDALLRTLMNITPYLRPRTAWGNSLPMRPSLAAHDVQGAFNNTQPEILIKLMILRRMPKYLIEWVKDLTLNRTLSFSFDNQIESPKPFCNGIPQGSPVSLILSSIMMSALMKGDNPKNLQAGTAYVDDLNEAIAKRQISAATPLLSDSSDAHEPNLPRAESVRAYLGKARAQARALLIIIIIIQVYCPYGI
jgi:hypothetical protein